MSIIKTATEKMRSLPPEKQQEVLDFIEFLQNKVAKHNPPPAEKKTISFLSAAEQFAGCIDDGPGDLAINKEHLQNFGNE